MIGMSGFSVLEEESRGDKLWVPTGTRAQEDYVSGNGVSLGVQRCIVFLELCWDRRDSVWFVWTGCCIVGRCLP